jgi:hypothetical protein
MQPVFHTYDAWRYFARTPFQIQYGAALRTKYTDTNRIITVPYSDISKDSLGQFIDLLQCHYVGSDRILTMYDELTLDCYFTGQNYPTYLSFYIEPQYEIVKDHPLTLLDKASASLLVNQLEGTTLHSCKIIPKPLACMSSRSIQLFIWDAALKTPSRWLAYYWDHVCIHRNYASKHLTRFLLQTNEYTQRQNTPDISVSLFRKDEVLCEGIVPLTTFSVYTFYLHDIKAPPLPPHFTVTRIYKENVDILSDFLFGLTHSNSNNNRPIFDVFAFPEIGSIVALIKQQIWYVYVVKRKCEIYAVYFMKNAKSNYEDVDDGNLLECVGSISNMQGQGTDRGLFFAGFLHALRDIMKNAATTHTYRMLAMADLSHTGKLLETWRWKYAPIFENKAAYYLYNMVVPGMSLAKERCLIII